MMFKSLVALAILSAAGAPALAETPAPAAIAAPVPAAKPQTVTKRVCTKVDEEDTGTRLGTARVCHNVEVAVPAANPRAVENTQGAAKAGENN
jgi:hypothetical protein